MLTNVKYNFEDMLKKSLHVHLKEANVADETFTFFWETKSPFSQWYKCSFESQVIDLKGKVYPNMFLGTLKFSSAEQFMMLHKALLFADYESAEKILQTSDVREQKKLGRLVKNFGDAEWKKVRAFVVYTGNKQKFAQNIDIREELMGTKGTSLVEAAPDDNIWGIGLSKNDHEAQKRETWKGQNILGEILTYIRIEFAGKY